MNAVTNANSGTGYQQMGTVTVHPVATGSFTMTISPSPNEAPRGVAQGSSISYTVTVVPSGGFAGTVSFSGSWRAITSGTTSAPSFTFNPSTVTGSGSTTMTVSSSSAGGYFLSAVGDSQSLKGTTREVQLYVDNGPPTVSLSAPSRNGSQISFRVIATDAAGPGAINAMNLLIAPSLNGQNACWISWSSWPLSALYLANDDASSWMFAGNTQTPLGSNGLSPAVSNSQCAVEGDQARVASSNIHDPDLTENQFSWSIPVTFNANFSGAQTIYVYVANRAGFGTGYQAFGTVTTP